MGKMTPELIERLYSLGKSVYKEEISLEKATEIILQKYPDRIHESSAQFYLSLYNDLIKGKGSTWNQNSDLLLYYVRHIAEENGKVDGTKAYEGALKFAKAKSRKALIANLEKVAAEYSLAINGRISFEAWLNRIPDKEYSESTVYRYVRALEKAEEWLGVKLPRPILEIYDTDQFVEVESKIKSLDNYEEVNLQHGHGDLSAALSLYRKYIEFLKNEDIQPVDTEESKNEGAAIVTITAKEAITQIDSFVSSKGFSYPSGLIENFYLCLKSKPFVILAGISGTGKTRLVRLFAEAIGATAENGRYKLVSVRPDWSDSSDLFGHVNLKGEFVPGAIIDFVKEASLHTDKPYFLCLDEMNLARVEYYLSDFLSAIETRHRTDNGIVTDKVLLDIIAKEKYGNVIIPENLYVIGTVNMDETTFPFSKKVLDRANTIEFSYVDLEPDFSESFVEIEPLSLSNEFLKTEYLILKNDISVDDREFARKVSGELQSINQILLSANAHVGYRVRDEIVFYMLNNNAANLLDYDAAMDNEIMQKILPRIQGSSASVKELLCDLFKKCAGDYTGLIQASISEQMEAYIDTKDCTYRKSAEKICYMMRRYEEDGFTSYWL